nr:MAG TPA: hypothetical protein [Caudoviricetes sp.]
MQNSLIALKKWLKQILQKEKSSNRLRKHF